MSAVIETVESVKVDDVFWCLNPSTNYRKSRRYRFGGWCTVAVSGSRLPGSVESTPGVELNEGRD